jgi:hypothetical protein
MTNTVISRTTYLQALALYTMASRKQAEAVAYEEELHKLLGLERGSRIGDGIYSEPAEDFDQVLGYAKIQVAPESDGAAATRT